MFSVRPVSADDCSDAVLNLEKEPPMLVDTAGLPYCVIAELNVGS